MSKAKTKSTTNAKQSFGKRREDVSKKKYGPKEERPKKYRGQGK
jgi:hypothetical protein